MRKVKIRQTGRVIDAWGGSDLKVGDTVAIETEFDERMKSGKSRLVGKLTHQTRTQVTRDASLRTSTPKPYDFHDGYVAACKDAADKITIFRMTKKIDAIALLELRDIILELAFLQNPDRPNAIAKQQPDTSPEKSWP